MQLPSDRHLATVTEYFQYENAAEGKHEYRNGEIIAMAGTSVNHVTISSNFIRRFGNALDGKNCRPMDSDLRIGIPHSARYTYPDLSIICGKPELDSKDPDGMTVTNPRVLVEILSPSTEAKDRGEKFIKYQKIETLQEYVLISQQMARVEVYRRQNDDVWIMTILSGLNARLRLESVGAEVPLAELYEGVEFPPDVNPE